MLIYNSTKEFIGIDEHDLKALGLSSLSQLQSEATDFADLFVRTPGYVHNFKHVHWIDFVSYAESAEESKVIISVHSKSYTASLSITKAYLTDNSNSEAYFITLNGLRPLSSRENETIASGVRSKPVPVSAIDEEQYKEMIPDEPVIEDAFDMAEEVLEHTEPITFTEEPYEIPDTSLDIDFEEEEIAHAPVEFPDEEPESLIQESVAPVVTPQVVQQDYETEEIVEDDDGYVFDPQVASDELGLPVDLIEEFIEDFTGQAEEFKAEIYSALDENDFDSVARLSHKLKGVAANLRVENALGAITTVNISKDPDIIKTNLDLFYRIMNRLGGGGNTSMVEKSAPVSATIPPVEEVKTPDEEDDFVLDFKVDDEVVVEESDSNDTIKDIEEDDFVLDFKEETPIEEMDIPSKIELPELADDDYLATDIETEKESQSPTKEVEVSYSKELSANAIGLDIETFEELFVDYINDSQNISSHIHQALAQNNLEKCAKEARLLKGMSSSMQVKEFTSELETLISSSDKNEMTNAIDRIDNVIEQISQ